MTISWIGAILGLALAIFLILKKVHPVFSLFSGALIGIIIGALIGDYKAFSFKEVVLIITGGTQSVMGTVVRIIAAGVLAGAMMETGAAESIARSMVKGFGEKWALAALAVTTMILTAVGVFIPVAVLIVAPIALSVGKKSNISKLALLVALSGGGKAGNVISPNPNTIAAAEGFNITLGQAMVNAFIPALFGLAVAIILAMFLSKKGHMEVKDSDLVEADNKELPSLAKSLVAPIIAIVLLLLGPIGDIANNDFIKSISLDAMYILPISGIIGILVMGQRKNLIKYTTNGLNRMTGTVMILIGAGALGGLISKSDLGLQITNIITQSGISGDFIAPIAGILMGGALASTSAGVSVGITGFKDAILGVGTNPVNAAVMMHTGATVIDHLPHGNYFHVTGGSMNMSIKERFKVVGFEALVGLTMTIVAVAINFIF
ncbi:predicted H+/gluconate symporter [Alteracholeplasma palmae J233]|uniref:Predicted H+/gluconate symporter n=1 Tax=Alteracholeplasma palmae (strain ATCC 49389 / J233) TaxID=1318466 RepID=U4KJX5_ALTPJ|nr:SLC13 family permease [Alteracholeplasma palmae]CCV63884.1 predicted H+/gluconate symporter [Alteracholeplasma palmae J233]